MKNKKKLKYLKQNRKNKNNKNNLKKLIIKVFIIIIIFLLLTIVIKINPKLKNTIYTKLYNTNFSFAKVKKFYNENIGNILPFENIVNEKKVFSEKLSYNSISKYNKGAKLKLDNNYLVPALKEGIIIFSGEKNGKDTVIIQQADKIDVTYSNLKNKNVKLYDYIDKNEIIGEVKDNTLYLSFQKDGVDIDYKKFIK